MWEVDGGLHGGHGAEEAVCWRGWLVADRRRAWRGVAAEKGGLVRLWKEIRGRFKS